MARKRKTRVAEALSDPENVPVQPDESELPHGDLQEPPPVSTPDHEIVEEEAAVEEQVLEEDVEEPESEEEQEAAEEGVPGSTEDYSQGDAAVSKEVEKNDEDPSLENGAEKLEFEDELEEEPLEKLLEPFSKDQLVLLFKEAVAKHPDITEKLLELAGSDPAHCKVFIHGLGWDANAETLTSVFGKYGEIEDCKVVRDKNTGKSKGYGFILFKHRDGARRALKQPQKLIEGRMTSCQLASAGPVQSSPSPAVPAFSSPNVSEYTQRKIYVSNVSAELDPNKLYEFFSRFGEIEEGPLGLDKQTGKPKGFCLFVYKSFESAKRALEEPHKNFEGQILHCQKAIDGPKYNRGHFNQQLQHQGHQAYHHPAKKGRYSGAGGVGHTGGLLMAPSAGPAVPPMGFNPAVAPVAIGQAVAALLASQGAGLGIGNVLGGMGPGVAPQGVSPIINNPGYGGQAGAGGYAGQAGMQGGYGSQPQIGPGIARPHQGGAPYMGHGH